MDPWISKLLSVASFAGGETRGAVATSSASNQASELQSMDAPAGAGTTTASGPPSLSKRRLVHNVVRVGPTATATRCSTGAIEVPEIHAPAACARGAPI